MIEEAKEIETKINRKGYLEETTLTDGYSFGSKWGAAHEKTI